MEKAKKANVDAVQFLEGFNKLRDEGKITSEERDSIIKLFT